MKKIRPVAAFQVAAPGKRCEDVWAFSTRTSCCVLCDGAGESYAATLWAGIVVRGYVEEGGWHRSFLAKRIREYKSRFRPNKLPWHHMAGYARGSFTTLLGLRFIGNGRCVSVLSIGDTCGVLLDGTTVIDLVPYSSAASFDSDPVLISTDPGKNEGGDFVKVAARVKLWHLRNLKRPCILLMTDALGRWFLERIGSFETSLLELAKPRTQKQFAEWVRSEQQCGNLKKDDCTLVVLR